jgi:NAD-dependent dihydropyrimidine dehydrogenase PreA subunit
MGEQLNKVFIDVSVEDSIQVDAALAAKLEEVCPVDIFKNAGGQVEVVDENVDECVLCRLCIEAAPAGTVHVRKLYDDTELS